MAKKSFKDNPALQFISEGAPSPAPQPEATPQGNPETPYRINPMYLETRSRRLNLLVQPSLHAKLLGIAAERQVSLNELIHAALEEFAQRNGR